MLIHAFAWTFLSHNMLHPSSHSTSFSKCWPTQSYPHPSDLLINSSWARQGLGLGRGRVTGRIFFQKSLCSRELVVVCCQDHVLFQVQAAFSGCYLFVELIISSDAALEWTKITSESRWNKCQSRFCWRNLTWKLRELDKTLDSWISASVLARRTWNWC